MTIQERAEQYANRKTGYSHDSRWREAFKDYCQGAESQKAIDDEEYRKDMTYIVLKKQEWIDKAVQWLNDNKVRTDIVGYFLDTQREEMRDEFIMEFKKAMEE